MKVAIAHAAFLPERGATLARLLEQLAPQGGAEVLRSTKREHASTWARRLWEYADATKDDVICLNDDTEVSSELVAACKAMLPLPTSSMVSLHTVHPLSRSLAEAGQRFIKTYHLTGPAYLLRAGVAAELLEYMKQAPRAWIEKRNEDNWAIQFAFRQRRPIWGSIPALAVHDTTIPSSLGYDNHPGRVSPVPWTDELFVDAELSDPAWWKPGGEVPFLETHWTDHRALATTEVAVTLCIDPETCWFCGKMPFSLGSEETGARICFQCHYNLARNVYIDAAKQHGRAPT
jgi:hypothetical protein